MVTFDISRNIEAAKFAIQQSLIDLRTNGTERKLYKNNWLGHGAQELGLTGGTPGDSLNRLIQNHHPSTGAPLFIGETFKPRCLHVSFTASKDMNFAYTFGHKTLRNNIHMALEESMLHTFRKIESNMAIKVDIEGHPFSRQTGNLIGFVHQYGVIKEFQDHHYHSHPQGIIHIPNVTYDPSDTRWKPGDLSRIVEQNLALEQGFHKSLRDNMQRLGYQVGLPFKDFGNTNAPEHHKNYNLGYSAAKGMGLKSRDFDNLPKKVKEMPTIKAAVEGVRRYEKAKYLETVRARTPQPEKTVRPSMHIQKGSDMSR